MSTKLCYVETDAGAFTSHRKHLGRAALAAGYEVHLLAPPASAEQRSKLHAAGFVFHELPLARGGMEPLGEARAVLALTQLFRRLRPSIVHNIALKSVLYGAIAARAARVPAIVGSVTGLGYAFMPGGLRRKVLSQAVLVALRAALGGRNVRTIVQNPDDLAFFVERGVLRQERVSLVYGSGVDVTEFAPTPEPDGVPVICVGTRMLWDKGIRELVEAAKQLRESGRACRFVLAGDPDPANPASISSAQLREWSDAGLVEWRPHTSQIAQLLRDATIACLPSYREGLPLFLAEAAASGRPAVTTDVPGCRSVVQDGVTGLLVPARDPGRLTDALSRLLSDRSLRQRMAENARRLALERFSKEIVTQQIFSVYQSLL